MEDTNLTISQFLGTDPILGEAALRNLLTLGDVGERALFSISRPYPDLRQQQRRWLRYVATREGTLLDRLITILGGDGQNFSRYTAAFLIAGVANTQNARNSIYDLLKTGFDNHDQPTKDFFNDYYRYTDLFSAWGYAGGSGATLWHFVSKSSYTWEKLRIFAFRAACSSFARINNDEAWALEQLLTHTYENYDLIILPQDDRIPNNAVDMSELWLQAYFTFPNWRRGPVVDKVLLNWRHHEHWRVRFFGAQLLAGLGFSRIVAPVADWLRDEPHAEVRRNLYSALGQSATPDGADLLLTFFEAGHADARDAAVRAIWRASDKDRARTALLRASEEWGHSYGEALVSLAKLGHPHPRLSASLDSPDYYVRLNAALAYAYLHDRSAIARLSHMRQEAAKPEETVMLTAALAMLGEADAIPKLHQALVAGSACDYPDSVHLSRAKSFLKDAVIDAFAAGGKEGQSYLDAWRAEIDPLDPSTPPVRFDTTGPGKGQSTIHNNLTSTSRVEPLQDRIPKGFAQGHALIIGVANYRYVTKLPETVLKDARDIAEVLGSKDYCGYPSTNIQILLDSDATADALRQGLRHLADVARSHDTAVVFFSGHGGRVEAGPDIGAYLIPFDCDPCRLADTALSSNELTILLSEIKAERLVVLLDACHSGGTGDLKDLMPAPEIKAGLDENTYNALAEGAGRIIMSSSRSDEVSLILRGMTNSLFTHYLLEALTGACPTHGDGLVRVFDVFHYISDNVPTRAKQHPIFKAHDVEANFPLALYLGGKQVTTALDMRQPMPVLRSSTLSGKVRLQLMKHLVSRWFDLATYLEIPSSDQRKFEKGEEPRYILEWLEERKRLQELRDAFNYLGWDDLIRELDSRGL